ncbi:ABC transporter substrate-binding protein [Candidatus Poribacteria bacterium]|nr:ABC transporter substrate-binding protein [Candidatus Poribacteria bacterium]
MNIRRFTRFPFVLAIAALIAGLSACDQVGQLLIPAPPQMEGVSGEISIGLVYPTTGRLASVGMEMGSGFELALEEINSSQFSDTKLKFITADSQGNAEGAITAFNKLIHQNGVSIILGPASSSATEAAFPIAQQNGVVAISATAAARGLSAIGDFVFRTILTTDVMIISGIKITQAKLGYQKAAILYDETDLFSADGATVMGEALAANGVEVLTIETFQSGDADFSTQLTHIKNLNPDAIFVSALPPDKPEILIQARQLGIPDSVTFIINTLTTADVHAAGDAAEGAIAFTSWVNTIDTPENRAFVQNYRAAYGAKPDIWAAQSYATVYVLAKAITDARSTDAAAIRDALANITDLDTVLGKFSFDTIGDAVYDPVALIVQNGELQIFE